MINYNEIRIEDHVTYLFIPGINTNIIREAFKHANITDYKLGGVDALKSELPKDFEIPFIPMAIDEVGIVTEGFQTIFPAVLISHMNTDDLLSVIKRIYLGEDEHVVLSRKLSKEEAEQLNREIDERSDLPPFPICDNWSEN